jgi:hypothetical protein
MNKQLIRELAITGGIYDCICDPYDKLENGDYYSSVMVDLERFAEKIVRECARIAFDESAHAGRMNKPGNCLFGTNIGRRIEKHFGVEE